jgi:PTS system fructose-specific IIC component
LAGYTIVYLKRLIKLPKTLEGLMPILILPVLSTLIVGLLMIYVIGSPMKAVMTSLTAWLTGMSSTNAVIFGAILGLMMAFDMGGPVNKTAYTFATGLLASNVFAPMAAVMAAGMTPPLGLALATVLFRDRFTKEEIEAGKAAWVLGASFITEGAIPFAAADHRCSFNAFPH